MKSEKPRKPKPHKAFETLWGDMILSDGTEGESRLTILKTFKIK